MSPTNVEIRMRIENRFNNKRHSKKSILKCPSPRLSLVKTKVTTTATNTNWISNRSLRTHLSTYDPNDDDNKSSCRYAIVGGCCIFIITVTVLLLVLYELFLPSKVDNDDTTTLVHYTVPICLRRQHPLLRLQVLEKLWFSIIWLKNCHLPMSLIVKETPHSSAADWILHNDQRLIQRYALAVFYFHSTRNGSSPWRSCNPPEPVPAEENITVPPPLLLLILILILILILARF